ncbi:MAG: hypothetical protein V9H25_21920 [Candidatus Competibacter sp.]
MTNTTASKKVCTTASMETSTNLVVLQSEWSSSSAGREALLQFLQRLPTTCFGHGQGVGAGLLIHHDEIGALAVEQAFRVVAANAQLDPRHVAQQHGRTVGIGAQDDLLEFLPGSLNRPLADTGRVSSTG